MLIEHSTLITAIIIWVFSILFTHVRADKAGKTVGIVIGTKVTINMLLAKGFINREEIENHDFSNDEDFK
tara:strand:- start:977 stop:1186 length:210 start_codon:yes stop_codon:yes gene_type:complete